VTSCPIAAELELLQRTPEMSHSRGIEGSHAQLPETFNSVAFVTVVKGLQGKAVRLLYRL